MTREELFVYIFERVHHSPSDIVRDDEKLCIAWNKRHCYIDIEIHKDHISVCISPDRKQMEMIDIYI